MHILSIDRNKSPLQISGKVPGGVCEHSRNFSGHPYIGRIARSSLRLQGFLVGLAILADTVGIINVSVSSEVKIYKMSARPYNIGDIFNF